MAACREQLSLFGAVRADGTPCTCEDDALRVAPKRVRRRPPPGKPRSINVKQIERIHRNQVAIESRLPVDVDPDIQRPRTWSECQSMPRPCPYVACRHHLYLDVNEETGTIKLNFPDKEPHELEETCSIDVGDHGGNSLSTVGRLMNLTKERARQLEVEALIQLRVTDPGELHDALEGLARIRNKTCK